MENRPSFLMSEEDIRNWINMDMEDRRSIIKKYDNFEKKQPSIIEEAKQNGKFNLTFMQKISQEF